MRARSMQHGVLYFAGPTRSLATEPSGIVPGAYLIDAEWWRSASPGEDGPPFLAHQRGMRLPERSREGILVVKVFRPLTEAQHVLLAALTLEEVWDAGMRLPTEVAARLPGGAVLLDLLQPQQVIGPWAQVAARHRAEHERRKAVRREAVHRRESYLRGLEEVAAALGRLTGCQYPPESLAGPEGRVILALNDLRWLLDLVAEQQSMLKGDTHDAAG